MRSRRRWEGPSRPCGWAGGTAIVPRDWAELDRGGLVAASGQSRARTVGVRRRTRTRRACRAGRLQGSGPSCACAREELRSWPCVGHSSAAQRETRRRLSSSLLAKAQSSSPFPRFPSLVPPATAAATGQLCTRTLQATAARHRLCPLRGCHLLLLAAPFPRSESRSAAFPLRLGERQPSSFGLHAVPRCRISSVRRAPVRPRSLTAASPPRSVRLAFRGHSFSSAFCFLDSLSTPFRTHQDGRPAGSKSSRARAEHGRVVDDGAEPQPSPRRRLARPLRPRGTR